MLLLLAPILFLTFYIDQSKAQGNFTQHFERNLDLSGLQNVFQIDQSYLNGGCGGQMPRLQTTFNEAVQMLDAAIAAVNNLNRPRPANTPSNEDAYNTYVRQEQAFLALFGSEALDPSTGLEANGRKVVANYNQLKLGNSITNNQGKTYYLFCGENWLKYLGPDEDDPGRPGEKVKTRPAPSGPGLNWRSWISYANGGWYSAAVGPPPHYMASAGPKQEIEQTSGSPFCTGKIDKTIAETDWRANAITLCPPFFRKEHYSVADLKNRIAPFTPLDSVVGVSTTMLHEWLHLFIFLTDNEKVMLFGREQTCYGWEACTQLAKQSSDDAIRTVETYALFGLAMYYDQWWWGTGRALKAEDYKSEVLRIVKKAGGGS